MQWWNGKETKHGTSKYPVVQANNEMQVKVGGIGMDTGSVPSKALSAALRADSESRKFRVSWASGGVGTSFDATALYNRDTNSLKFYTSGYWVRDETSKNGIDYYQTHATLSHITDEAIHKLAADDPANAQTAGFIDTIKKYGAVVVDSKTKKWKSG